MKKTIRKLFDRAGFRITRRDETIVLARPDTSFSQFSCLGVDWNETEADAFLGGPLTKFRDEYLGFPVTATENAREYYSGNDFFGLADAAVAHCMVRTLKPKEIIEVGSGFSSRVLRKALDLNGSGRLTCIDPDPRSPISGIADEYLQSRVEKVPASFFDRLSPDSIFFIDSSHRALPGSDVTYLFLEILPRIPAGCAVHIHDIYLPFEYPAEWNHRDEFFYNEQYLLQAFLQFNREFNVIWPGRWMLANRRAELGTHLPDSELKRHCSLWIRRKRTG